jgi:hypothetical protein
LDSLHWLLIPKSPFLFKILSSFMPRTPKHACSSHPNKGAINSSPEVKPSRSKKLCACLGGSPLTLLTTFSTVFVCWVVEFCVLLDVAWFYDIACVGSL